LDQSRVWGSAVGTSALAAKGVQAGQPARRRELENRANAFAAAERASTPDNDLDGCLTSQTALARTNAELGDRENGSDHLKQADHFNSVMDELHMHQAADG
jgi:hypothetical protein